MSVVAVIVARNEEGYIEKTILSIIQQNYDRLILTIIVDDGSTDNTVAISQEHGCMVIQLPYHKEGLLAKPELAERWNQGFKAAMKFEPDYIFTSGADHQFPSAYLKTLVEYMEATPSLAVTSGIINDSKASKNAPSGSGRLIRVSFWKEIGEIEYPVAQGWESWILYKALEKGYKVRAYQDLLTKARPVSMNRAKALGHGKGMWTLGYNWKYALGRIALLCLKNPIAAMYMFIGWAFHYGCKKLDVAPFVNNMQNEWFFDKVKERLGFN